MKTNRIGKKCNELGRKKKQKKLYSSVSSVSFVNNDDNIRKEKKAAQKAAAKKKAKFFRKSVNGIYLVEVLLTREYICKKCGYKNFYCEEVKNELVYASSIEEAVEQISNVEEMGGNKCIKKVEYIDYSDTEYYFEGKEYADHILIATIYYCDEYSSDYECEECKEKAILEVLKASENMLNNYSADNLFNIYAYAHGVYAYNHNGGTMVIPQRIKDILTLGSSMSICCSWKNQPIGPVGVYVKGSVEMVSNKDLNSYIKNGERKFSIENSIVGLKPTIIDSPNDLNFEVHNHIEVFVRNPEVVGIWVKDWFVNQTNNDVLASLREIARNNDLAIHVVKARREE